MDKMAHDLDKLDEHFGLQIGTSYKVIIQHNNPKDLNKHLESYGIILDEFGMVPKKQRPAWKKLLQSLSIDKRYWKDNELLYPDTEITLLEGM